MKKIVSFALCIAMLCSLAVFVGAYEGENYIAFSSSAVTFPKNQHISGDSNGDGKVDMLDVIASLKYITGDVSSSLRDSIDTNYDGQVTALDVLLILRHILGDSSDLGELVG